LLAIQGEIALMPSNGFRSRINIQEKELEAIYLQKRGVCGN
jgi:hypothetical protein